MAFRHEQRKDPVEIGERKSNPKPATLEGGTSGVLFVSCSGPNILRRVINCSLVPWWQKEYRASGSQQQNSLQTGWAGMGLGSLGSQEALVPCSGAGQCDLLSAREGRMSGDLSPCRSAWLDGCN